MTEDAPRPSPTANDIKEALNRTGFLLEYRVAQVLREQFHASVDISRPYPDPETGKSREIDVSATIEREVKRHPINLGVYGKLIIECKNSSAPFVLIGDHGQDIAWIDDSIIMSFDPLRLRFPKAKDRLVRLELKLEDLPGSAAREDFTGYQLLRLSRQSGTWKADNSSIYDSILYPLAKAWSYEIDRIDNFREQDREDGMRDWEFPNVYYVFPIIVTSNEVYTVDLTSGEPEISMVKWARIKRSFKSEDLECDLRADLVSFDHWKEYLESRIVKIVDGAENVIARNLHLLDPEWLLANYGEPEEEEYFRQWLDDFRRERDSKARS